VEDDVRQSMLLSCLRAWRRRQGTGLVQRGGDGLHASFFFSSISSFLLISS
jgi:hypothetical protein